MLERLVNLQERDEKIVSCLKEESSIPENLEKVETRIATLEAEKEKLDMDVAQFNERLSQINREVDEVKELQRKSQARMLAVKTQREYQAVGREAEGARKRRGELEGQAKEINEEKRAVEDNLLEVEAALKTEMASLKEARQKADEKLKALRREREDLEKTRDVEASLIDPDLLARYQKVFNRYKGKGVVKVSKGVCYGCFMTVPPQLYNQVLASGTVFSCPNCGRIIYVEEA